MTDQSNGFIPGIAFCCFMLQCGLVNAKSFEGGAIIAYLVIQNVNQAVC